jgi:uncharacterized protein
VRVVVDTNVLVSSIIKTRGAEAAVMDSIGARKLDLCVSDAILAEYSGVLFRPRLRLDRERVQALLEFISSQAIRVSPRINLSIIPDDPDNRFLECAETAKAHYLVTGNKRHFPKRWKDTEIVNARELIVIARL